MALGFSGPGGGSLNRLFDAGLNVAADFTRNALDLGPAQPMGYNPAYGGGAPGTLTVSNYQPQPLRIGGMTIDSTTLLIGGAVVLVAVLLARH